MAPFKTFILTGFRQPVEVTLTHGITEKNLLEWPAFKTWTSTLHANLELQYDEHSGHAFHKDPFALHSIEIQSVDWFGTNIGFLKLAALIKNPKGKQLPGICFLRGGSVAMLMILRPKDSREDRWVVLTEQPRVPAGSLRFLEIPAGMIDKSETFGGAAAKEIEEETGFKIPASELLDLTNLALQQSEISEPSMKNAMYPSPGGSDEFIPIFLWEKELDRQEIEDLRGKLTGQRTQGEMITLHLVRYDDLWREGARDAKTLAAWALYEGLNREGAIRKFQSSAFEAENEEDDTREGAPESDAESKTKPQRAD
ncbi:hypothetical protein E8E13_009900 [Curvularia kusanoi]|uniref:Nudix hydrolase domain-containing protein n=1 Tax=Curvularia kusanoi TaxID=90978 RepID=A0A9P4W7J8_CURKU|nr:hypothetical protein E8E13_009900 [Curvularia kusanoi]